MNFSYEMQDDRKLLVLPLQETDRLDTFVFGIMTNENVPGILPFEFSQSGGGRFFRYDVTNNTALKDYLVGVINKNMLLNVFQSILSTLTKCDAVFETLDSIVAEPEYVFVHPETREVFLICLPLSKTNGDPDAVRDFFKKIVINAMFESSENNSYVTEIINFLNRAEDFTVSGFEKLIGSIVEEDGRNKKTADGYVDVSSSSLCDNCGAKLKAGMRFCVLCGNDVSAKSKTKLYTCLKCGAVLDINLNFCNKCGTKIVKSELSDTYSNNGQTKLDDEFMKIEPAAQYFETAIEQQKEGVNGTINGNRSSTQFESPQNEHAQGSFDQASGALPEPASQARYEDSFPSPDYGETTVLWQDNIGETTVLSGSEFNVTYPFITRKKNDEIAYIDKKVFIIGKDKAKADYYVAGNPAISRVHAEIRMKNGEYYIVDKKSTNHTFLDNELIEPNVEVKISHGERIRLGDEEFEFKLN